MAVRTLTPLSDWPAGPHPSCNGRFVAPRYSVCTRLHASSSLDNPVPSRFPNPSLLQAPSYLVHQPPPPLAAAALVPRIISKYNHWLPRTGCVHIHMYKYICMQETLIHICTEVSESWPAGHFLPLHMLSPSLRCESTSVIS